MQSLRLRASVAEVVVDFLNLLLTAPRLARMNNVGAKHKAASITRKKGCEG